MSPPGARGESPTVPLRPLVTPGGAPRVTVFVTPGARPLTPSRRSPFHPHDYSTPVAPPCVQSREYHKGKRRANALNSLPPGVTKTVTHSRCSPGGGKRPQWHRW